LINGYAEQKENVYQWRILNICSTFGEDWSINHITILSTDAGHGTSDIGYGTLDTSSDFTLCPVSYIELLNRRRTAETAIREHQDRGKVVEPVDER